MAQTSNLERASDMDPEAITNAETSPVSLSSSPELDIPLSDYEAALDRKRWKVHGEDYEKVEERLQAVCSQVHDTIAQLIGAMRDLELWQATAAKTCELPTNSLAKITVITSQMVRSRSTLSGQLGTLQDVCRCFFPSTMLLEITGQRELQARAEVEIEKWAQLAFSGQQTAKTEFRTLRASLRWYRLSKQLTDGVMQQIHQTRVRKLRARIGDLERRNRGLRGQLAWEKKRADRAFGALHINRKLARSLAPGDWDSIQKDAVKSVNGDKGWASARGVDTRTPRQKGELSSRSVRPSTRGGAGQNGRELRAIEKRMRASLGDRVSGVDRNGDGEEELFPYNGRPSEMDPRRKGVTNADFAAAVASLTAKIREATNMRIGSVDESPPVLGIAANNLMSMSAPLPGDFNWAAGFGSVSISGAANGAETVDTGSGPEHPLANGPARSPSPVLNTRKTGKFIPSLNLWKKGVAGALKESEKGEEASSSSEGTPKNGTKKSGNLRRDSHLQRNASKAANRDGQPGGSTLAKAATSASASTSASLPKLTSAPGGGAQSSGIASERNGTMEQSAGDKLPSISQAQNSQTQSSDPPNLSNQDVQTQNAQVSNVRANGPVVPRLPLGALSARRYDPAEEAAGTERLAKALGIDFAPEIVTGANGQRANGAPERNGIQPATTSDPPGTFTGKQERKAEPRRLDNELCLENATEREFSSEPTVTDRPRNATERGFSSVPTITERPGSVTERGTASTSAPANGDESRETFTKRDFLTMRLEQSRQLQHLQSLYEERIQSLHAFYEKLLQTQLPAVLAQMTASMSGSHSRGTQGSFSDLLSTTPEASITSKEAPPKVAASLDSSRRGFKRVANAVQVSRSLREPLTQKSSALRPDKPRASASSK
ncbi:hypothetical protein KFL_001450270 [Klebsormidium nitens]|uniref:Uncharacterized protein n=1 Tax=Klebsormidium nitens TaxID=105231 RepID=A0A1Y1HXJ4_KLENI|nr:hypothetical protein KFL_001450270 [Klebsormidium nitens]|eukprot:GAQ83374.1 hypothetical protein KFL_001450270 [Klebsormidium nitens]